MDKYIKYDNDTKDVIDVFFDYQTEKMKGEKWFIEDNAVKDHKLYGKSISTEDNIFRFYFNLGFIYEKTDSEIEAEFNLTKLDAYKQEVKDRLYSYIKQNWPEINKTKEQIRTQWLAIKTDAKNATTKQEIDTIYNNAITWLGV